MNEVRVKRLICLIALILVLPAMSYAETYYVDASGGSDSQNGTSESNAWKTISKVNDATLSPGDSVLFKCGETWNDRLWPSNNGTSEQKILFGSYGSGDKPVIDVQSSQTNCIKLTSVEHITLSNLHVKNANGMGITGTYAVGLTIEDCIVEGSRANNIYVSADNFTCRRTIIRNSQQGGGGHGLYVGNDEGGERVYNNVIEYCVFEGNDVNGLQFNADGASNIVHAPIVRYNIFRFNDTYALNDMCADSALIYGNLFYENGGVSINYEPDNGAPGQNARIFNNTIYQPDGWGSAIYAKSSCTGHVIKNNIIYYGNATTIVPMIDVASNTVQFDNNLYYAESESNKRWKYSGTTYNTFEGWQDAADANALFGDPLFEDPENHDFHLQVGSPAIDAGLTVDWIAEDFDGTDLPSGSGFDIGALEFIQSTDIGEMINAIQSGRAAIRPVHSGTRVVFHIHGQTGPNSSLSIYNIMGKRIWTASVNSGVQNISWNRGNAGKGVYLVALDQNNLRSAVKFMAR